MWLWLSSSWLCWKRMHTKKPVKIPETTASQDTFVDAGEVCATRYPCSRRRQMQAKILQAKTQRYCMRKPKDTSSENARRRRMHSNKPVKTPETNARQDTFVDAGDKCTPRYFKRKHTNTSSENTKVLHAKTQRDDECTPTYL